MHKELLPNQIYIEPRFVEVDMMKVVHHSKYIVWFEESRFSFLRNVLDISIPQLESSGILMPVIDCYSSYKRPVLWSTPVIVDAKLELCDKAQFNFYYSVYSADKKALCAKGKTSHVFIDYSFQLKLTVPKLFKDKVSQFKSSKSYAFFETDEYA